VIESHNVFHRNTFYLGDRIEDQRAVHTRSKDFIPVDWGYGHWDIAYIPNSFLEHGEIERFFGDTGKGRYCQIQTAEEARKIKRAHLNN
jgi:hypothetical protein